MIGTRFQGHPFRRFSGGVRLARSALWVVLLLSVPPAVPPLRAADDTPNSVEAQVTLVLKALTYDRQLEAKAERAQGILTVGIVYNPLDANSTKVSKEASDVLTKFATKRVKGLPLRQYLVEYSTHDQLDAVVKSKTITVFYICPGVKGLDYLLKVCEQQHIATTTGVPDYVKQGVAVGVGWNGERPEMFVNRASAKAEGIEFDASLLRIVTRVGE